MLKTKNTYVVELAITNYGDGDASKRSWRIEANMETDDVSNIALTAVDVIRHTILAAEGKTYYE